MRSGVAGAVVLTAMILGGCTTQPLPENSSATVMPDSRQLAPTPAGFVGFCLRFMDQCQPKPGDQNKVSLNEQTWQTLQRINRDVNNSIWPQDDLRHYGRAEYWTIPTDGFGACHAYALTKKKTLSEAGLPTAALRLAVVYSQRSGYHAVLTVATDQGDFVLDNLTSDVLSWNAAGYIWLERQDASDPMRWVSLQPVTKQTDLAYAKPWPDTAQVAALDVHQ